MWRVWTQSHSFAKGLWWRFLDACGNLCFHFKQSHSADNAELFYEMGSQWLDAVTEPDHESEFDALNSFIQVSSSHDLRHWLAWWHDRRRNWSKAFCPKLNNPNTDLSECYFSTCRCETNLALVDAVYKDVIDAIKTESIIEGMDTGTTKKGSMGKGPSQKSRERSEEAVRRGRAKAYTTNIKHGKIPQRTQKEFTGHQEKNSHRPDTHRRKCPKRTERNQFFALAFRKAKGMRMELLSDTVGNLEAAFVLKNKFSQKQYTKSRSPGQWSATAHTKG